MERGRGTEEGMERGGGEEISDLGFGFSCDLTERSCFGPRAV
jgi:hypothetical protein